MPLACAYSVETDDRRKIFSITNYTAPGLNSSYYRISDRLAKN